ncbi:CYFA0S23e01310g1_1 [Cyberlindnera fabianii]|uniref:CYFA0S23e01310g1_1 n=1 Tax=Cyberlindnera fabianii TaxID=36022 RepID=A0A061B976_CYBFA|nr:Protein GIS4 [Cyberlindnera fabianii]CDR46470.1 CYFA0S23e01310g1_1 [Cyberlindnera fabianii]
MATFVYTSVDQATEERYGDLWSWYLESLESGEFENIVQDTRRRVALDQFVSKYVTSYDSNILILLLPSEDISRSPSLLTSLLSRYYDLNNNGDMQMTVTITPIGTISGTQTSVIMAREVQRPSTLSHRHSSNKHIQQSVDADSVFSGELGYVPSLHMGSKDTKSNTTTITMQDDSDDEDTEQDLQSINSSSSITSSSPSSSSASSTHLSITGASLTRVITIQDNYDPRIYSESPTEPIVRVTTQGDASAMSYSEGEVSSRHESQLTQESSTLSLKPFPTMVSTTSTCNHRLVLRSMLLRNLSTNETKTAIRQIEGDGMGDDWMLYDETFSMTNLQLLSLDEVAEAGAMSCKFLFYALIADPSPTQFDSDDEELAEHDLTVVEFDGHLQNTSMDSTYPIRFVQSNTTEATTPLVLSKTNTLRTTHESIRSEMLMHRPDATYSVIQQSKSTPTSSSIRKIKKKKRSHVNTDKCVIM